MPKKIIPINYTSRDFETIKNDLIQHAKRYYSNVYKDFNEASFGSLMLDTTAYIGDILSFYLDYQANETFLDTAVEFDNIIKLGRQVGFKYTNTSTSTGIATFYINVPSNISTLGPNYDYAPVLKKGSIFSTTGGTRFLLTEDVRFDNPASTDARPSITDNSGNPTFWAIKTKGTIISGDIAVERIPIGEYTKYLKIPLSQQNIVEILSVFDSEGNEYFEVENLAQNVIYRSVTNRNLEDSILAKEVLKPFMVPRRFVVERQLRNTFLQFGASSDVIRQEDNMMVDPKEVVLEIFGKNYISTDSFDPTRLINSDKLGIAPSNTELIITYRYNNTNASLNFAPGTLRGVINAAFEFTNEQSLQKSVISAVKSSLEVENEVAILGDTSNIDSQELKIRIQNSFSSQNRAVTENDYKSLVYNMPNKYGSIKRVSVRRDDDSLKRNINLYVVCEDYDKKLTSPNISVKNNIKNWLLRNKMINDSIDILDGKIVNYGITFSAIGTNDRSKYDILTDAINQLKEDFSLLGDFGESLNIVKVYDSLRKVNGLIDVVSVNIEEKVGGVYSDAQFNFKANTSADGRLISVPQNVIMELKYPNSDIKGTIL